MSHYISTNRSKHYLKCHLILVTKYRRNILVGQLNDDLKDIFTSIANNSDFEIEVFESDINHIHFLIRYIPRLSISQIVRRLKQESTRQIWLLHHSTLRQYYWYQHLLWSDGYFVCSIGEASPETIRQYILNQGQSLTSHRAYGISGFYAPSIKSELITATATTDKYETVEQGDSVYFYTNISSEENNVYYGGNLIEEVKKISGYNIITGWYGKFLKTDMVDIYKQCFLNLRLTKIDGFPNTNMEMGLMGRRSVFNGGGACSLEYKTVDDICFLIDKEYKERSIEKAEKTRQTMLYFKNENEKRFKEFIGMPSMLIH